MHRNDGLRARRDGGFEQTRVHGPGVGINVDEDRCRVGVADSGDGGDERHRHRDHFVTRANAEREHGEVQGRRSSVERNAMLGSAISGEVALEVADAAAEYKLAAPHHLECGRLQLGPDGFVLRLKIEKWDHDALRIGERSIGIPR